MAVVTPRDFRSESWQLVGVGKLTATASCWADLMSLILVERARHECKTNLVLIRVTDCRDKGDE